MSVEINENLFDYSVKKRRYRVFMKTYMLHQKKEVARREETKETARKKSAGTAKKSGSEEYLKTLQICR